MPTTYYRSGGQVKRLADGALIPEDDGNADYQRFLAEAAANKDDATYVATGDDPTVAPEFIAAACAAEIDEMAESARMRFMTPGAGQARVYSAKLQQAQEFQAQGGPASKWGFIVAESEAMEITPAQAAARIIAAEKDWVRACAKIEKIRLAGKRAMAGAVGPDARAAVMAEMRTRLDAVSKA